jgi:hypothetical protein
MNKAAGVEATEPSQRTVVVLGNARSGTSVVAGLLTSMGVHMDSEYGKPDHYAPKGYFESLAAHQINTKIFQLATKSSVRFVRDAHFYPPDYEEILKQQERVKNDIVDFVKRHSDRRIWGFKNPKTSLTVELYLPHLVGPCFIVTCRNPVSNAAAIHKTYGIPFVEALDITNYYNATISGICSKTKIPKLFINFEQMQKFSSQVVDAIASFLSIDLDERKRTEIEKIIVRKYTTVGPVCFWRSEE